MRHKMTPLFYLQCKDEWEVIGNIFDNPELLNKREETCCKEESKCIKGIYAIQNIIDFYNTSAILNNNLLKNISEKLKTNLYIVPVTAHILLICKYNEFTPEEIQMALKIFGIQEEEDYLSSDIFIFNKESGELSELPTT